jgi:hypothetical protein
VPRVRASPVRQEWVETGQSLVLTHTTRGSWQPMIFSVRCKDSVDGERRRDGGKMRMAKASVGQGEKGITSTFLLLVHESTRLDEFGADNVRSMTSYVKDS